MMKRPNDIPGDKASLRQQQFEEARTPQKEAKKKNTSKIKNPPKSTAPKSTQKKIK
ncbi:MAG: hypothetical protein ABIN57_02610 [Chitinophagaceae bacterium]